MGCSYDVSESKTIEDLKYEVAEQYQIDEESLMFLNQGIELDDCECFGELGLTEIRVETQVHGAGKGGKRKKKVYKTPKRIPHKKKPIKQMALRYYAIGGNGDVTLARKMCERCIIMMGNHYDRNACGKCGLTHYKLTPSGERLTKRGPQVKKVEVKKEEEAAPA